MDGIERCIDDEIPFEIPDSWEWKRLENIALLKTGTTPSTSQSQFFGDGIPFVKPADITNLGINYCNESLTMLGAVKSRIIDEGSVLMVCIGGSIGKCYFSTEKVCCNQQINTATPIFLSEKYLCFALQSDYVQRFIKNTSGGTATPIINKSLWGKMYIPIPPIEEQQRIGAKVEHLLSMIK